MLNKLMTEFNELYAIEKLQPTRDNLLNVRDLITDEIDELSHELRLSDIDLYGVAAELTDVLYITAERMRALGFDVDALLEEKHRSNLSKVLPAEMPNYEIMMELQVARERYPDALLEACDTGYVLRCDRTGKVIKPLCYSKAVITDSMIGIKEADTNKAYEG